MANYNCAYRTNYYHVTNETLYKEILAGISSEDFETFQKLEPDGRILYGFGGFGDMLWHNLEEGDIDNGDSDIEEFYKALQGVLPEDEALILMESGNEKLKYVTGLATIVTRRNIEYLSLTQIAQEKAGELLGNLEYSTQMEY